MTTEQLNKGKEVSEVLAKKRSLLLFLMTYGGAVTIHDHPEEFSCVTHAAVSSIIKSVLEDQIQELEKEFESL